jgi:hypothetical protein
MDDRRTGRSDEEAFEDAVDRDRAGDKPDGTPPSNTLP